MTIYDTYGTPTHTAAALARIVAAQLGLTFAEHDSYYRGLYLVADAQSYRIEIQPNAIPGDDGQDDLYDPEHPEATTLLLVTGPHRVPALDTSLGSMDALVPISRKAN